MQILLLLQQNFPIDFSGASQGILTSLAYKRFQNEEEWKAFLTFLTIALL